MSGNVSLYNETEGTRDPAHPGDRRPGRAGRCRHGRRPRAAALARHRADRRHQRLARPVALAARDRRPRGRRAARRSIWPRNAPTAISSARMILAGAVRACHDVSDGGMLVARRRDGAWPAASAPACPPTLATSPATPSGSARTRRRYLRRRARPAAPDPRRRGRRHPGHAHRAHPAGQDLTLPDGGTISLEALRAAHERFFPPWMDGPPEGGPSMAMAASEIEALIKAALPDARVTVEDLAGDGDHYAATVVSETFRGIPRVKQHQIVYAALRGRMGGELHALALQTSAPDIRRLTNGQTEPCSTASRAKITAEPGDALHEGHRRCSRNAGSPPAWCRSCPIWACRSRPPTCWKSRTARGDQGVLAMADHPAALCQGRVRRRLRHHHRDVPVRRTRDV